jgi:hypothetical protein
MITKSQIFKSKFPEFKGVVYFYTSDSEQINFINVEDNIVDYTTSFQLSCKCCYDYESNIASLDYIMDDMSDTEFDELCDRIAKLV